MTLNFVEVNKKLGIYKIHNVVYHNFIESKSAVYNCINFYHTKEDILCYL